MSRDVKTKTRSYDVEPVTCDKINVIILSTNGYENASVFEMRVY